MLRSSEISYLLERAISVKALKHNVLFRLPRLTLLKLMSYGYRLSFTVGLYTICVNAVKQETLISRRTETSLWAEKYQQNLRVSTPMFWRHASDASYQQ